MVKFSCLVLILLTTVGCAHHKVSHCTGHTPSFHTAEMAFQDYDFHQTLIIMQTGASNRAYSWTNPTTCHSFEIVASHTYEDTNKPILYQTCRRFRYSVTNHGKYVGRDESLACRHFTTHQWVIY